MVQFRENTFIKFQLLSYLTDTIIFDKELILSKHRNNEFLFFASLLEDENISIFNQYDIQFNE